LTTTNGTWNNSPTSYAYQWQRNGANIGGATSSTYTQVTADAGQLITCIVTATNAGGSEPATSNQVYTFDADFNAVKAQATSLGYTLPNTAGQRHLNAMLLELKAGGFWTIFDVFYMFANNGSTGFSQLNWKAPASFQCTLINAPTWTSNKGYNLNGTSQYLDTNFNPSVNGVEYTLNNAGRYAYVNRTTITNNHRIDGNSIALNDNCMIITQSNTIHTINSGTNQPAATITNQSGFQGIVRTSSTAASRYFDLTASINVNSTSLPNATQWIGRSGTSPTAYGTFQIQFYAMGSAIGSGDIASFKAILDKYLNSMP